MHNHLHKHLHHEVKRNPAPDVITSDGIVMSVVYVTAQPTFTGAIGGYSTVTGDDNDTAQQTQTSTATSLRSQANTRTLNAPSVVSSSTAAAASAASSSAQLGSSSRSIVNLATASGLSSITAISTTLSASAGSSGTNAAAAGTTTADASATSASGMSAAGKAGLAIGIICAIGAVAALCLILLAKKRRQRDEQARQDSEKNDFHNARATASSTTSSKNAPRLSLRPVSRLVPELMGGSRPKSRLSQGNMLTTFKENGDSSAGRSLSPATAGNLTAHRAVTQTPTVQQENPFQDPENPFADPEKRNAMPASSNAPIAAATIPFIASAAQKPHTMPDPALDPQMNAQPAQDTLGSVSPLPTEAPTPIAAQSPKHSLVPAPITIPAVNRVASGAPSPVVAQGPGPEMPVGNVYRILIDFNPTMEDELGLRAGQHVRLLHEYDDGWALCIRLDRSQQGVVPRTCLAAKPSKPRPMPGARGPGTNSPQPFRPGPPQSGRSSPAASRPITPNNGPKMASPLPMGTPLNAGQVNTPSQQQESATSRAMSPGAFNQAPRPLSPGPRPQKRSMSPGPYGASGPKPMAGVSQRRRSNSASALNVRDKRNSPPGPSKLGPGLPMIRSDSPGLAL